MKGRSLDLCPATNGFHNQVSIPGDEGKVFGRPANTTEIWSWEFLSLEMKGRSLDRIREALEQKKEFLSLEMKGRSLDGTL